MSKGQTVIFWNNWKDITNRPNFYFELYHGNDLSGFEITRLDSIYTIFKEITE